MNNPGKNPIKKNPMRNQVQLIAYVDRLAGAGLGALEHMLGQELAGLFGGVHLLPFFDPIDGADAGFDPTDHTQVDPRLGDWGDIRRLGQVTELMADVIVNHVSADSPQFLDYLANGEASQYAGLFLTREAVFPKGASAADIAAIYRPRPGTPFTERALADGTKRAFWTTFTPQQVDIDVAHPQGRAYLARILSTFAANGIRMVRLDAVGYAIKKPGTSCFMLPETFGFIDQFAAQARALGIEVLVEIHSYYRKQVEIAARVDWVYDFALPPLVLHAIFFGTARWLKDWIAIRPRNALTVLDTHDGIGIIDIGADASDRGGRPGLVPPAELDALVERIHANSQGASRKATGAAASNLDLLQKSGVGRDINRHHYGVEEVRSAMGQSVVQRLCALIRLRNMHPAFGGDFELLDSAESALHLRWTAGSASAELQVDLVAGRHSVSVQPSHLVCP